MKKEITAHCIAQTACNRQQTEDWLNAIGAHEFAEEMPYTRHQTTDPDGESLEPNVLTDAELLVGVAGKRCYNSFEIGLNPNVTKIRGGLG